MDKFVVESLNLFDKAVGESTCKIVMQVSFGVIFLTVRLGGILQYFLRYVDLDKSQLYIYRKL